MCLRGEAKPVCYLLYSVIRRFKLQLYFVNQIIIYYGFRRFAGNTTCHLCQIATADIQQIGVELNIASLSMVFYNGIEQLIVKFATASLKVARLHHLGVDFSGITKCSSDIDKLNLNLDK